MNEVFIVIGETKDSPDYDSWINSVYSNKEVAQNVADKLNNKEEEDYYYYVTRYRVWDTIKED